MTMEKIKNIEQGRIVLGIELGSTRIKSVLMDYNNEALATGGYGWKNDYIDNIWTYSLEDVWKGLQSSYEDLVQDVKNKYGIILKKIGAIGISAMMHGYMAFDENDQLLVPFRTWRNNVTGQAAAKLTELFNYNIPQRWSIAHLYQAILNEEKHVKDVRYITTLAGYIHWQLTGRKVIGVGDAAGMFPIDIRTKSFNQRMIAQFNELVAPKNFPWRLEEIMPQVLVAGEEAGVLTREGAKLLDPSGELTAGIPLCPPEGDAGTGMVATNSVAKHTGNVSAGTSIFANIVLEKELSQVYTEIDLVTTPSGDLVAMAHSNNCTSDINGWVSLFQEFCDLMEIKSDKSRLFEVLFKHALKGEPDGGGLLTYGYLSGEHITNFEEGRPLFVRSSNSNFNLANFMRVHLLTALGAMKIGTDILLKQEKVKLDKILGHGGFFKTEGVGQSILAAALDTPVTVMSTAGEGGAWGIAILASYLINKQNDEELEDYLNRVVFLENGGTTISPDPKDVEGFERFMERYKKGLAIERAAVDNFE